MLNKLLDNNQRKFYENSIKELFSLCQETIKNKVPEANVQQGFVLDTVKNFSNKTTKILSVGAYEDTAAESLRKLEYNIVEIDPLDSVWNPKNFGNIIKTDLNSYYLENSDKSFDVIFSTSVIEHVENDILFLEQICKLLSPNGYGIITCDFNNNYKLGDRKPVVDFRLYTVDDFLIRFSDVLTKNNCSIFGQSDWSGEPDFDNGQAKYSFATFVFKKNIIN